MTPARWIGKCTEVDERRGLGRPPRRHATGTPRPGRVARCEALETLPRALRERRRGVEEEVEVGEEALARSERPLRGSGEPLEAARDVEVEGRRDLAQVRDRLVEPPRRGLAVVDVERSAVEQHHVEVVVAAERVAPRQPVDDDRRALREEGPHLGDRLLVRAEHPLRVDHPLGCPVDPDVKRILAIVSGSDRGARAVERDPRRGAPERAHCRVRGAPAREEGDAGERGGERARVQGRVVGEDDAWARPWPRSRGAWRSRARPASTRGRRARRGSPRASRRAGRARGRRRFQTGERRGDRAPRRGRATLARSRGRPRTPPRT